MEQLAHLVAAIATVGAVFLTGCQPPEEEFTLDPARVYLDAKTVLLQSAGDRDAAMRSHAIEGLAATVGTEAGATYLQALDDENPAVQFAAALAVADTRYAPALGKLREMAKHGRGAGDKRVYCAVILALHCLGDDSQASDLGKLLFHREREVRMDAALAMGRMGEPSATGPLKTLLGNEQDEGVRIQLTESLAMLGDTRSAEVIEAYTKGYFLDLRLAAIPALARVGTGRARLALKELIRKHHPARVRVSAAGELARMGQSNQAMYDLCMASVRDPQKVLIEAAAQSKRAADRDAASLRRLAILSLGWMKRDSAGTILHPRLKDRGDVRVAAALSLMRLFEGYRSRPPVPKTSTTRPTTKPATTKPAPPRPKLKTAGAKD